MLFIGTEIVDYSLQFLSEIFVRALITLVSIGTDVNVRI